MIRILRTFLAAVAFLAAVSAAARAAEVTPPSSPRQAGESPSQEAAPTKSRPGDTHVVESPVARPSNEAVQEVDSERSFVLEYRLGGFNEAEYQPAVEALFKAFEAKSGKALVPGEKGRVGLKVYTSSGAGISTPLPLVRAVVAELVRRGYQKPNLFIADMSRARLREAGFLPRISEAQTDSFEGVPVLAIEGGQYYSAKWFYDNPLPSRDRRVRWNSLGALQDDQDDRKSFLPVPLLMSVDFWINMPMVVDHPALGVCGALANATLLNASNNERFWTNPANAPVAAAEIAAIPELQQSLAFTLMTLERYQFIGGPRFISNYTASEPLLWLSANPVALDYLMYQRMNLGRQRAQLPLIEPEPPLFQYGRDMGLGDFLPTRVPRVPVR